VERVDANLDQLHVLLRHRLLLQAHGFKGLLSLSEETPLNDAPVAKGNDGHAVRLDLYSIPAPEIRYAWYHDGHAAVDELSRRDGDPLPRLKECVPEVSALLTSVIHARLDSGRPRPIHNGLGIDVLTGRVEVSPVECVHDAANDLHVLL